MTGDEDKDKDVTEIAYVQYVESSGKMEQYGCSAICAAIGRIKHALTQTRKYSVVIIITKNVGANSGHMPALPKFLG